jgi:tetratricopeptide (TPR) repeat protein
VFALSGRARVHEKLGHHDEALADLEEVVALAPGEFVPHNQLGVFYWRQRRFKAAAQALAKVIEMAPDRPLGYGNRGIAFFCMGRYDDALASLTQGLERGPKDAHVNSAIAWLLVAGPPEMRDPQRAAAIAASGLVLDNKKTMILGGAWFRLGRYAQAKEALTDAVQLTDESSMHQHGERLLFLAMACHRLGHHGEAQKRLAEAERWIKENSGPEDVHLQTIRDEAITLLASPTKALQQERKP